MDEKLISEICLIHFSKYPKTVERCAVGLANYVYIVTLEDAKYIFRGSTQEHAYDDTVYWLEKLSSLDVPVPKVVEKGRYKEYEYLILSFIEGRDIGLVYLQLGDDDKRAIAKEIVHIQNKVAAMELDNVPTDWSWCSFVYEMLERAETRIANNAYFDTKKVAILRRETERLKDYFSGIKPVAYLDDVSTKNLMIHNGRISGIVDVDWMGVGDKLTYVALTNMALLNMGCDTDYVKYILEEMQVNDAEMKAFQFYTLMFCVDFMGERGMQFVGRTVEVNEQVIERLNSIYDKLLREYSAG